MILLPNSLFPNEDLILARGITASAVIIPRNINALTPFPATNINTHGQKHSKSAPSGGCRPAQMKLPRVLYKEVIDLCRKEMDSEEKLNLPEVALWHLMGIPI